MIMFKEVADISSYQPSSLSFMQSLSRYATSIMVKITQGSATGDRYLNPKAAAQVANGLRVFKSVGAYHYFKANSQRFGQNDPINEAKWFIQNLQAVGLDKSTVCALDIEDPVLMNQTTHDINLFLKYMTDQGYHHLVVYASASWFTSGRIKQYQLYNQTPIWVASYGSSQPGVNHASAWQYTDNGHGLHVDFSYDFDGTLIGDQSNATPQPPVTPPKPPMDAIHLHAQQVFNYFHAKGLSDAAICGILGNFQHESSINPAQWQYGMPHTWSMYSKTGYGIAQFTPAGKIKNYADRMGKSVSDINVQLDYIWGQVTTSGGFYGGGKTFLQFAHETNPRQAALEFLQGYEMHFPTQDALAVRQANAANWWQIYNLGHSGTYGTIPSNHPKMDLIGAQATTENFQIAQAGKFIFNTNCRVRNTTQMADSGVATYAIGNAVNYDRKVKADGHFWLSYESASGTRHYVPYANITTGTYFGNDSNNADPIEHSGTTIPTPPIIPPTPQPVSTPEGYTVQRHGSFTFNTNCRVRDTLFMNDDGVATYKAGMTVNYDSKIKNDNHYWLSYISVSGTRRYIPYGNIAKKTYFGTDTNPGDPVITD